MEKQFWIENIQVDLSRNQIVRVENAVSLQPKILAVLKILALHQGQVVSHDKLMDEVWGESTVSPNTLQRCIAQLRKALGDDSRSQQVIKTHSKQGYSLEKSVHWGVKDVQNNSGFESSTIAENGEKKTTSKNHLFFLKVGAIFFVIAALSYFLSTEQKLTYSTYAQLTTSDEKEYFPNYSPDGRYLVFHRYLGTCENHIWAKDLQTQEEIRLTATSGIYGAHDWSSDGNQLAFVKQENCQQTEAPTDVCWRLQTLDFAAALKSPIEPVERLDCDKDRSSLPTWLNNGKILLLKKQNDELNLMSYDARSDQLSEFYKPENGRLYDFHYSPAANIVSVLLRDKKNRHYLEILDEQGQIIQHNLIKRPEGFSFYEDYAASFHPSGDFLITNSEKGLYRLSLSGELSPIETPAHIVISTPSFHPKENKIIATGGAIDIDIGKIELETLSFPKREKEVKFNQVYLPFPSVARTTKRELQARFNPVDQTIAFASERTGEFQIWLAEGETSKQLSQFKNESRIRGLDWSPDGKTVAVSISDKIALVSLEGLVEWVDVGVHVKQLVSWSEEHGLLLIADVDQFDELLSYDLNAKKLKSIGLGNVQWAGTWQNNIIVLNYQNQVWKISKSERSLVPLPQSALRGKPIGNVEKFLYGIDNNDQLWQFDLTSDEFKELGTVDENVWWVMDGKDGILLVSQGISARKEIIELRP